MSDIPLSRAVLFQLLTPLSCTDSCFNLAHTWTPSCLEGFYSIFKSVMIESMKIYPPLYLLAAILRKEKLDYFKKRFLLDVLQSSLAISINGSCLIGFCCVTRKIIGRFYLLSMVFLPGLIASLLGIITERRERQGVLALYMSNLAVEMLYNMMKENGYVIPLPYGEVWLFCIATSIMMYLYRSKDGLRRGFLKSLISFFIGPKGPEDVERYQQYETRSIYNRLEYKLSLDCIKHSVKAFTVGYVLQMIPYVPNVLRRPGSLFKVLLNRENFNSGFFLGSYVAIFKGVEYALTLYRKKQDNYNALIAGGLSGLSMMFYRSSVTALYLASKIVETLYKRGKAQGSIPSIPHAAVWIYSISTALVFHGCMFEAHYVRRSYWRYLNVITRRRFSEINRSRLREVFRKDCERIFPAENIYLSLER